MQGDVMVHPSHPLIVHASLERTVVQSLPAVSTGHSRTLITVPGRCWQSSVLVPCDFCSQSAITWTVINNMSLFTTVRSL